MLSTGHYYTITHPDGRIGIRYSPAERNVSLESAAHRERQALRPEPTPGRVVRMDRGAVRVRDRASITNLKAVS